MISNERVTSFGHRERGYGAPKPQVVEDTIHTEKLQIERKTFILMLKENPRGRFLRITEDVNGRRDTIIIPATGLEDLRKALDEIIRAADEAQPKTNELP